MKLNELHNDMFLMLESKNSIVVLDVDETLIHISRPLQEIGQELTELMEKQSPNLAIKYNPGDKGYDKKRLQKAYDNYKYKDSVIIFDHPDYNDKAAMYVRPHLCEFIQKITGLPKDLAKGAIIYTANYPEYASLLVGIINKLCGSNLSFLNKQTRLHPDSIIVDDFISSAQMKLLAMGISKSHKDVNGWVPTKKFKGDFTDNNLAEIMPTILSKLKSS